MKKMLSYSAYDSGSIIVLVGAKSEGGGKGGRQQPVEWSPASHLLRRETSAISVKHGDDGGKDFQVSLLCF